MSDYVVPLTSPVQLTNIDDIHAVDLHVRYCELVKAYGWCSPSRPSRDGWQRPGPRAAASVWAAPHDTAATPQQAGGDSAAACYARGSTLTAAPRAGPGPQPGQEGLRAPGPGDALGHVEGYGRLVWARGACGRGVPPPHAAARQRQRKLAGSAR